MKLLIISCSQNAYRLSKEVEKKLENELDYEIMSVVKCNALEQVSVQESLMEFVGKWFYHIDAILFLCATGIAVRSIAPYIQHKGKDPAVLVMDEGGNFCISLLSGHMGGANALTKKIADKMGANAVITTATDVEGKFSVDSFACSYHLSIENWQLAKNISAAILQGEKFSYISPLEQSSIKPGNEKEEADLQRLSELLLMEAGECFAMDASGEYNVSIDYEEKDIHHQNCLCLIPKVLILGIGCKKNTPLEKIGYAVKKCFHENHLYEEAICQVASIDIKKEEAGIKEFCVKKNIPFVTFSSEELMAVEGTFSSSAFVSSVTGVDNVCERSAMAACKDAGGRLIVKKTAYDGVTISIARRYNGAFESRIHNEEICKE